MKSVYPRTTQLFNEEERGKIATRIYKLSKSAAEWPFGKEPLSLSRNVVRHWNYYSRVPQDMDIPQTHKLIDTIEKDLNRRQALRDEKKFLRNESDPEFEYKDRAQVAKWLKTIADLSSEYPFLGPDLLIEREDLHNWACNTGVDEEIRGVPKRFNLVTLLEEAFKIFTSPKRRPLFITKFRSDLEKEISSNLIRLKGSPEKQEKIEILKKALEIIQEQIKVIEES